MWDIYVQKIWNRRPGGFFNMGKSVLILNSTTCQASGGIPETFTECNSELIYSCWTLALVTVFGLRHKQTLYRCLKTKLAEWIEEGQWEYTNSGKHRRASNEVAVQWIFDVWKTIATNTFTFVWFDWEQRRVTWSYSGSQSMKCSR